MYRLIAEMVSLVGSEETLAELIPYGDKAIVALREYLLKGKPHSVYQSRQQAVLALAALGAREVLLEYLSTPREINNADVLAAEQLVESSAARELVRWKDPATFKFLMQYAKQNRRTGALEALAEFRKKEAAPLFIAALEDDYYRPAGEQGLRKLGSAAKPRLLRAALTPSLDEGDEPLWSLRRRQAALSILADIRLTDKNWQALRPLLTDEHPEIAAGLGTLAATVAPKKDRARAAEQIVAAYRRTDYWRTFMELDEALTRLQPEAIIAIDRALENYAAEDNSEAVWRLRRIVRRIGKGNSEVQ